MKQLSKSKQLEFLANDVAILETMFANQEGDWVVLPGTYMPDGKEFRVSLEGINEMTGELRKRLVDTVKDQYDARETEQNAPKEGEAAPYTPHSGGEAASASDREGGTRPVEDDLQSPQETLLSTLREKEESLRGQLEYAEYELGVRREHRNNVQKRLQEVMLCIDALLNVSLGESENTEKNTTSKKQPSSSKNGGASSPTQTSTKSKKS